MQPTLITNSTSSNNTSTNAININNNSGLTNPTTNLVNDELMYANSGNGMGGFSSTLSSCDDDSISTFNDDDDDDLKYFEHLPSSQGFGARERQFMSRKRRHVYIDIYFFKFPFF